MLLIEQVSKHFSAQGRTISVLQDLSLRVDAGQMLAITGNSGSGKSTLLLLCATLIKPDAGRILFHHQNLHAQTELEQNDFRAKTLGYVFQQFCLVPYLSARDNILLPAWVKAHPNAQARADELLSQLQLSDRAQHRPAQLSIGERQRVSLARALLHRPALILADEPTGNLDDANAALVAEALRACADQGATVMVATHDPRLLRFSSQRAKLESRQLHPVC